MRIFAIGDIHGRYDLLDNLLNILQDYHHLNLTQDKLIFMGDYIDRGPQSLQVLEKLNELQHLYLENVVCLLGNHEQLMLDWYDGCDKWGLWLINGGRETLASFLNVDVSLADLLNLNYLEAECPKKLIKWLKKLPISHYEDGFVFTHAPLPKDLNRKSPRLEYFTKEECIWTCGPGKEYEYSRDMRQEEGLVGVCGHVHALREGVFEPRVYDHYIFTDAGCGCHPRAPLCAVEVVSRQVIYSIL